MCHDDSPIILPMLNFWRLLMFRSMRALFCCVFGVGLILVICVNVYITICLICLCLCGYLIKEFFFCVCVLVQAFT